MQFPWYYLIHEKYEQGDLTSYIDKEINSDKAQNNAFFSFYLVLTNFAID